MWIGIISLFPEMFRAITDYGVTGRAVKNGLLSIQSWSPRDFTHDRHRTVDDRPYGGGPGMLMMVQPLRDAIHAAKVAAGEGAKVIYLSPQGRKLDQAGVSELATNQKLIPLSPLFRHLSYTLCAMNWFAARKTALYKLKVKRFTK